MHATRLAAALLIAPLALLAGACRREAPPAPDAVARIGGEEVRYASFAAYLARAGGDADSGLASDALSALFDQFVDERLLARLAVDRGVAARSEGARRAVDALLAAPGGESTMDREPEPSPAEIEGYYAAHRELFARPERVRLLQILVESRATAERARREIAAGADFREVARRLARGPRAVAGGTLGGSRGELARADLPPAFADTIFNLAPGAVSPVIPAEYGFHLFQVAEHLPAETVPLAEVAGEIRARLQRERADRHLARLVGECRKRYNVEVYTRNLPFDYEGIYRDSKTLDPRARRHPDAAR